MGGRLNYTLRTIRGEIEAADQVLEADHTSPQRASAGESARLRLSFCCLLQKSLELSELSAHQKTHSIDLQPGGEGRPVCHGFRPHTDKHL